MTAQTTHEPAGFAAAPSEPRTAAANLIGDELCRTSFGDFSEQRMQAIAARLVRVLDKADLLRAEAAALPAAPAPLAVERLALAVHALQWPEDHEHPEFNVRDDVPCWEIAQRLAVAYAEGEPR